MHKELELKNRIEEISRMEAFVEEISDTLELDMKASFNLNLALEEVVTNVISYAYPSTEEHVFQVIADGEPKEVISLQVIDDGVAFDPLKEAPEVDITLGLEERPVGGLGIFLVRKIMNEVVYERLGDKNILSMKMRLKDE